MRPSKDMLRREFIGMDARVVSPGLHRPIAGKIVDETRNMICLEARGKQWSVPKKGSVMYLRIGDGEVTVQGDWILGSPEDRIKKRIGRPMR